MSRYAATSENNAGSYTKNKHIILQQITPYKPTHPDEVLHDELNARGISQSDFAAEISLQPTLLNEILKGKRPVTADVATLLETALDIPAKFWMQFQSQYEQDRERNQE